MCENSHTLIWYSFLNFFYWRLIALQYCAGSATGIHMFLPSWTSLPSCPSRLSQSTGLSSLSHGKFPLAICFTYSNVYVSMLLSQFIPLSPSPTVSTSLFSMSASQAIDILLNWFCTISFISSRWVMFLITFFVQAYNCFSQLYEDL